MTITVISELVGNKYLEVLPKPIYITLVFAKYALDTLMEKFNNLITCTDFLLVA